MRKAALLLAVLGMATFLWAEDPSVGTWKLNVAKSKFAASTEAAIKEEMIVIREAGDQWEIAISTKRVDGSSRSIKAARPKQGGIVKMLTPDPDGEPNEQGIDTVVEPGNWFLTLLQNGKQVGVTRGVVSKDGKTMRQITKGIEKGKPYEEVLVYERQ